ncbi:RagB/SusD family nutrient uptake outer membrane protein [Ferruginibacter sp. HRS2-29]|nr:RagB/SusD family nutrient uptake outer membrane protein [Ferruginibacter sp. HRS2-29]
MAAAMLFTSCAKNLDLFPANDLTGEQVYSTPAGYKSILAKIYGTLAISGNQGPAGSPDIGGGLDEGSQVGFIRAFFNLQELPTDEAVVAWDDQTIKNFHNLNWNSSDPFILGMYARPIYNITLINEYLRQATDENLTKNNITGADAEDIKKSRAEARFMRAFNYWVMIDLFGKSTFITEADGVGTFLPGEKSRAELFTYVESELLAIQNDLSPVKTAEYGRVDQGACWGLLARLYLNAKVYTGADKYTEAITFSKKVIGGGYSLSPRYATLFMADNDKQKNEFIFTANCDGLRTQGFGNTSFFIHAPAGGDNADYGASGGWAGYRATKGLADLFPRDGSSNVDSMQDKRAAHFYTSTRKPTPAQIAVTNIGDFSTGMAVRKYVNKRLDGQPVSDVTLAYSDIDFPLMRLPEMYLIYAEAVLRGGTGGDAATALSYVNLIRARASATPFLQSDLTLQSILDERGRELFWEGHRRTDLIRYGLLTTGTYLWPWKGGVASGTAVDAKFNIYPIPASNRSSNPNLSQNDGY